MDHDHGDRIGAAIVQGDQRLQAQRRAIVEQRGATARLGPGGGLAVLLDLEHRHPRHRAGEAGVDQEADVDAAHVVAFLQVGDVVRRIGAGGVELGRQRVQRIEVLDLDRADDVRGLQPVADDRGGLGHALVEVDRADGRTRSVGHVVEQAQHVEAGDGDVVAGRIGHRLRRAGHDGRRRGGVVQQFPRAFREVAAEVGEHADQVADGAACIDARRAAGRDDQRIHLQAFLVGIEQRHRDRDRRVGIEDADAGLAQRALHAGDHDLEFAVEVAAGDRIFIRVAGRLGDDLAVRHAGAHAFQVFQDVGQAVRAEHGRGDLDRGRQCIAAARDHDVGRLQLGARHVEDTAGTREFIHRAGDLDAVADIHRRRAAGEHEDRLRGGRVGVRRGIRGLQEEAV